jgi:calcineurin-like phosphoesterase family protein
MTDFRQLYLDYLNEPPGYMTEDRHGRPAKPQRSRVRYPKQYEQVRVTPENECIDLWHKDTGKVFVWSDQHFGHKNIIKYSNRPFDDTDHMRETMIRNHNEVVGPDDVCIWVGDVAFLRDELANEILHRLNGYKILVVGNHDMQKKKLKKLHVDEVHLLYVLDCGEGAYGPFTCVFTHFPVTCFPKPNVVNIHGHTHDKEDQSPQHINVSVERIGYKPVPLPNLLVHAQSRVLEMMDKK